MWTTQGNVFDQGQHASVECFLLIVFFKQDIDFFYFLGRRFGEAGQQPKSSGSTAPSALKCILCLGQSWSVPCSGTVGEGEWGNVWLAGRCEPESASCFCKREIIQHLLGREETLRPLLWGAQGKLCVKNRNSQLYGIFDFQWVLISNSMPQKCCTNLLSF